MTAPRRPDGGTSTLPPSRLPTGDLSPTRPRNQNDPGRAKTAAHQTPSWADPAEQDDAYLMLVQMLREWGLESLAPDVLKMLQDGRTQEQISILLQDTDAYKHRFIGNEARRKAGLSVLSPKEYLQTEAAYRQIMESAGLPSGFYDSPSDFADWIGADVSPSEIKSRVDLAVDAAQRLDDGTRQAFRDFYGLGPNDLAAYFLDRERALPQLQQIARGAQIGGAGYSQGLAMTRQRAEQLAASVLVGDQEIAPTIGRVATLTKDIGLLGGLYGSDYTQTDAEQELFFADEKAKRKRQDLTAREVGQFSGSSGVSKGSLASGSPGSY